jgi:hypothetical protein
MWRSRGFLKSHGLMVSQPYPSAPIYLANVLSGRRPLMVVYRYHRAASAKGRYDEASLH